MKIFRSILLALIFFSPCAQAELEFFFNTSPSDPPKLINKLVRAFPMASVGHGTIYVSSACRDPGGPDNLIRPCTKDDPEPGLVISFDVDLQKNTGYYFLAVSKDEFFYGTLDKEHMPERITRAIIEGMDQHFYEKFPLLNDASYFAGPVRQLSKDTGLDSKVISEVLTELSNRGVDRENLRIVFNKMGLQPHVTAEDRILGVAKNFAKNGISPQGMSRRVVTWAVRLYQGVWSLVYPTTEEEELALIEYINSLAREKANILSVNCVMPLDIAAGALTGPPTGENSESAPRQIYVPYFVMQRLVKGAFTSDVEQVNEFGEFIRRPGAYMQFYPQIDIAFDDDVPRAPKSVFQDAGLVSFYRQYQGKYANYIDWTIDQLKLSGVDAESDTIKSLQALRKAIFKEEKEVNRLRREYEGSAQRDPATLERIERMEEELRDRYDDELMRIMGAQAALSDSPGSSQPR